MGKLTISMAIFNSYVKLPEGIDICEGISKNLDFPMFSEEKSIKIAFDSQGRLPDLLAGWHLFAANCC
jgi:hypothetical protein